MAAQPKQVHGLWFGERLGECEPELRGSSPRRPFFRSHETPPRKARVLVNLSGARVGRLFLDPFCGTGSLVIEAARIGSIALGADVDPTAVAGATRNAAYEDVPAQFYISDARSPSLGSAVDAVATDLPYGRSASRHDEGGRALYARCLEALAGIAGPDARVVVMSLSADVPARVPDAWELAWKCTEEARTVTRDIAVWHRA